MMTRTTRLALAICTASLLAPLAQAADDAVFAQHPAAADLARIFAEPVPASFKPSSTTREAYLKLIAGNVDFFKSCQDADGAIIDPVKKSEVQYSTPAFAAAAGTLVVESGRKDLLEPATKAMSFALKALVAKKAANEHSDFYIPLLMHAYAVLKERVSAETRAGWEADFRKIDIRTQYRTDLRGMNWNIVSSSGELLRRHAGLVENRDDQWAYLEQSLAGHVHGMTKFGLYDDPNEPLAYDAFSRLWLEDVFATGAYEGKQAATIDTFLKNGSLSSLLLMSPQGEWASGGRSAFHQWNEAELAAICEMEAVRWKKLGRADVAGALKRGAHLAVQSMMRWQRPTGEMNIVKNHAEPAVRFGYEGYSSHSQYNILPMAMLAMAYGHADETIAEHPLPAETSGYVFDLRETFHKVVAAGGGAEGYYVLIDTAGDPHYNATGLQRIHKAGITYSPLSDSSASERAYGPGNAPKEAIAPGLEWKEGEGWTSLADFTRVEKGAKRTVKEAALTITEQSPARTVFSIVYTLDGPGARAVSETYTLSAEGVELVTTAGPGPLRVRIPALLNDGATNTKIAPTAGGATITHAGATLTWSLEAPLNTVTPALTGPKTVTHQGYVQALSTDLPESAKEVRMRFTLTPAP